MLDREEPTLELPDWISEQGRPWQRLEMLVEVLWSRDTTMKLANLDLIMFSIFFVEVFLRRANNSCRFGFQRDLGEAGLSWESAFCSVKFNVPPYFKDFLMAFFL